MPYNITCYGRDLPSLDRHPQLIDGSKRCHNISLPVRSSFNYKQDPIQRICEVISPTGVSRVQSASQSGMGDSYIMKADDKDHSKPDYYAIKSTSETCWQYRIWLQSERLQKYMVVAAEDIQDGSLLYTSEVQNLMLCEASGCQLCHTILASIRLQAQVKLPGQEPFNGLTRYSLYLLPDTPGWTIKILFEAALEVLRTDLRLVLCNRIKSEDVLGMPQWALDSTGVGDGKSRICFQQPHEGCIYRLDTNCATAQIKKWIDNCKSLDQSCCGQRKCYDKQGHPFRLLFLGDEHALCPRLVDANTMGSEIDYVTLSHRWDSSTKSTETTRKNILSAYQNISLNAYPTHFKEAMSLTKRLGFKYISIDSLCIIQDCPEDWSKQAILMHHIYSNGVVNLALLQNFADRKPMDEADANAEVLGCKITSSDPSGSFREPICWKPENFDFVLQKSHLYSRGWTFQERLLSPRTVHFGKQMYWECRSRRASTAFPSTVDYPGLFADDFVLKFKQLTLNSRQDVAGELHSIWCSVVRDYSGRDLTKPSDRLVALSGVAKRLQHIYSLGNDEYSYGLWKPCLPEQLLWGIEDVQRVNINQTNAGPSWSWVSHMHLTKFVSLYLGSEFLRQRLATFIGFHHVEEKIRRINLSTSSSNMSATLSLNGILIPLDKSISRTVAIEIDCSAYEPCSNTYLLPILGDVGAVYGLVLQSISIEGDIAQSGSIFRRLGLFQGRQTIIEEILYKRQLLIELLSN